MKLLIVVVVWPALACVTLGAGCTRNNAQVGESLRDSESQTPSFDELIEAKLDAWSPSAADTRVPPDRIRDRSIVIAGDWIGRTGRDSARMTVARRSEDSYEIEFAMSGCLARWQLKRTGTYRDGVLTLNRPVQEYCPITFKVMYAIRVDGKELLLPAANVDDLLVCRPINS